MRDLRRRHRAQGAVLIADDRRAVVVELAAGLEGLEVAGNLVGEQAGDEAAEVVGVGADVAEAAGRPGALRVGAPAGLLLAFLLQPRPQPALDVAGADGVDLAQFAGLCTMSRACRTSG